MEALRRLKGSVFDRKSSTATSTLAGDHKLLNSDSQARISSNENAFLSTPRSIGSKLNLTFFTDRLIVMGTPVTTTTNKTRNENNVDELADYLEQHHTDRYLIISLNSLHSDATMTSIRRKLQDQILDLNWDCGDIVSHTPPIEMMFAMCYALDAWFSMDKKNVALLYCQSGKTRSGVVIACYFLFTRVFVDPMESFVTFYRKRWNMETLSTNGLIAKTPPSILRYLTYFHALAESKVLPNDKPLLLKAVMFCGLPVEAQPCIQLYGDNNLICSSDTEHGQDKLRPVIEWNMEDESLLIIWEHGIELDGGFSIVTSFSDVDAKNHEAIEGSYKVAFRYNDSTWFLTPGIVKLRKSQVDVMKHCERDLDEKRFCIELVLHDSMTPNKNATCINYTGKAAVQKGLIEISKHHIVSPDPVMHSGFVKMGFAETSATLALQLSRNSPNSALGLLNSERFLTSYPRNVMEKMKTEGQSQKILRGEQANDSSPSPLTTANIVALQSQRCRYPSAVEKSTAMCCVCQEDDYMKRPQIVKCTSSCGQYYHTTCAGLRKIPFGLTTLSDCTNHAVYVRKYFSTWGCDKCIAEAATSDPISAKGTIRGSDLLIREFMQKDDSILRSKTNGSGNVEEAIKAPDSVHKLRDLLRSSGVSFEDLLRAATNANNSVALQNTKTQSNDKDDLGGRSGGYGVIMNSGPPNLPPEEARLDGKTAPKEQREPKDAAGDHADGSANSATTTISTENNSKTKYELMLKHGVPFQAVQNCMLRDGADPNELKELQANHSILPQEQPKRGKDKGALLLEVVPKYQKYFKMIKLGCPKEAVRQKMRMDGIDTTILDRGHDAIYEEINPTNQNISIENNRKEREIGAPNEERRLSFDKSTAKDTVLENVNPVQSARIPGIERTTASQDGGIGNDVNLGDHPVYAKYFKMLKVGLPEGAVRLKMESDEVDQKALELGPNASFSQLSGLKAKSMEENEILLKDHPAFSKYFKMLRLGLPDGAVQQKMISDGVDPGALDLGGDAPISQLKTTATSRNQKVKAQSNRRKKLHWQPIAESRLSSINQQTIWEDEDHNSLDFEMDMNELEALFFTSNDVARKKVDSTKPKQLKRRQTITLIDGKKAMNAGISLARVKVSHRELACGIHQLNACSLTVEQLMSIREFLPTAEEVNVVTNYKGDVSLLGDAEKFILEIAKIKRYQFKMDALIYIMSFEGRSKEVERSLQHIKDACREVKDSRSLKILLGMVLKLGNTLNGSGHDNEIRGFTVDSLLRLGHTKAINKKTTVLHYLVKLIKRNHPQVLNFQEEMRSVSLASRESMDAIESDYAKLTHGLQMLQAELQSTKSELLETEGDSASEAVRVLRGAIQRILHQLQQVDNDIQAAKKHISGVLEYFGEDPEKNSSAFFNTLSSFCLAFEVARKEVDTADEATLRLERMKVRRSATMR
uniref:Forminhomology 2 domaincontaining protein putative n=1 Tax=Albugo laibachii Nc14 TaxID=890382 RepID=F0WP85_9STRA|nr:forminhomology 2 domaincontaining protein putative [Albugo laibachii Nc14]|eukprot:CCA23131.1 forminhomology 2 domaincontaining protein putative [Albugo laibachii Nc14]